MKYMFYHNFSLFVTYQLLSTCHCLNSLLSTYRTSKLSLNPSLNPLFCTFRRYIDPITLPHMMHNLLTYDILIIIRLITYSLSIEAPEHLDHKYRAASHADTTLLPPPLARDTDRSAKDTSSLGSSTKRTMSLYSAAPGQFGQADSSFLDS